MTFAQHIISCVDAAEQDIRAADHPDGREDCTVIYCTRGDALIWHSHADAAIDPNERLNPDITAVTDHTAR